ncbi:MAG: hypothetical protein AABZ80_05050 [Gemmatimonadota bacterium]
MRRSSEVAAFLLAALVLIGPAVLAIVSPSDHNLSETAFTPLVLYWTVGSALLIAPLLALTTLPGDWFERWWRATATYAMSIPGRTFATALVSVALVLTASFSWYCFATRPTTADEFAQLFHARILLSGWLSLPPDPNVEFFAIDNVIDRPRWMSQFPIGGPAVLALGLLLGAPWLPNSLLTAFTALNVYRFVQAAYGEAEARVAGALFVASPMVLMMGGSQMNHTPTVFFVTLALASLAHWLQEEDRSRRRRQGLVIGIALGAAVAIRPLDGALAAVMMGAAMGLHVVRHRRVSSLVVAAIAGAVPVALLLVANWRMTGHPLLFGYEVLWGPNHSWGLHDDPLGSPHDGARAVLLGLRYATLLDWTLTAWPVPVLLLIAFGFSLSHKTTRWDLMLLGAFVVFLVAYALYWHDGQFIGPRFLFTAVPAVLILAARAPFMMADVARGKAWRAAVAIVPVCVFVSWVRPMPPFGVRGITQDYREARKSLKRLAPDESVTANLPRSLVFVQEGASARLVRRLWALGVSRQDAARVLRYSDACSLLDAVRVEERREPPDAAGRLGRIEASTIVLGTPDRVIVAGSDPNFRVNNASPASRACIDETKFDARVANTVSYGPLLLENRFDALGRVSGQVIYAMNLGERNDVLRARFGDRQWFRYEIPLGTRDSLPVLVPYEAPPDRAATKKTP